MKTLYFNYLNAFKGLSTAVWWLALITLINRAGTMVIPFLSLYLTETSKLSLNQIGTVMVCFGLGSLIGSWVGGKLTDSIGYYKIMLYSLFATGILFLVLQFIHTFYGICFGIFVLMVVGDMFRPAMFVALSAYSKPEAKTRSITLIRLAINLGFSAGPALGGIIISYLGYKGLFWVDGITCLFASLIIAFVLNPKKTKVLDEVKCSNPKSAYKDKVFLVFLLAMFLFGFIFLQIISTIPLYYSSIHKLSEFQIGLLLGCNGLLIFLIEMPLMHWLEKQKTSKLVLIMYGAFLTAFSYLIFNIATWSGVLLGSMVLLSLGEMIAFPISNSFALDRAKKGNQGQYMALYSIAFSLSHIFCHKLGMYFVFNLGFAYTWYIMAGIGAICMLLLFDLHIKLRNRIKLTYKTS